MRRKLDSQPTRKLKPIRKTRAPAPSGVRMNPWGGPTLDAVVDASTKDMPVEERAKWHFTTDMNVPLASSMKDARGYKPLMVGGEQVKYGGDLVWMLPKKEYDARIRAIGLESVAKKQRAEQVAGSEPPVKDQEGQDHQLYGPSETEET